MSKTHFGFKEIFTKDKDSLVHNIFSSVADKYDLMNDAMSFGIHHIWKKQFVSRIENLDSKILDVACGTGDISFRIHKKASSLRITPNITSTDVNQGMLDIAEKRAVDKNILHGIKFVNANAEDLPFEDNAFDYYTISFGIRNVTNIDKALAEARRVLKPGGKFLCLEFSKVDNIILNQIYNFYSMNIIPKMGGIIAGDKESYQYLVESIRKFPSQIEFKSMIQKAGFETVRYSNLSLGVCAIHEGK